jgi:hypothetical protein
MSSRRAEWEDASNRLELVELSLSEVGRILHGIGQPYGDAMWLVNDARDRVKMLRSLLEIGLQREASR